ncbi:uncharacterized protein LOC119305321 [Triticum dicoccoides]|uniref:uncharacterized protein LOC119305321 n=1 Tax=Triticum dicoccoides TaxID=85692 RepID=UPI00188F9BC3|nr:uncharacterized protein LOC119305321 [Triticum dicoccoides]
MPLTVARPILKMWMAGNSNTECSLDRRAASHAPGLVLLNSFRGTETKSCLRMVPKARCLSRVLPKRSSSPQTHIRSLVLFYVREHQQSNLLPSIAAAPKENTQEHLHAPPLYEN